MRITKDERINLMVLTPIKNNIKIAADTQLLRYGSIKIHFYGFIVYACRKTS